MSRFRRGEWVRIVDKTPADPYMIQMRETAQIEGVIDFFGGAALYYVTLDSTMTPPWPSPPLPPRYGPFPEARFRAGRWT